MMRYLKAIVGALVAGLGTLATALSDDGIEAVEWVWVAISFLGALGAVWAVPNLPPPGEPARVGEHRADPGGHAHRLPPPGTTAGPHTWTDPVGQADAEARDRDPLT